eukprot:TRINITY_DN293_c0_g1_i9.p1 TRINITY_DN293_c0_g1~~TRINITY_DN293_c0_g1_i9.p1  ORF type:complete len:409 (+),score=94.70 TRINITY_DN293_c0_g1_i9:373-1599(+)
MAAYNAPVPLVDPIETQIHLHFNQMVYCVNQRREAVLTMYRDLRQEIDSRPLVRARRELELTALRTETDNAIQMNQNRQLQQRILREIDLDLAEIRTPHPDTRVVFRSESTVPLEQLIAQLGEVLEEEVPTVPDYQAMRPVVAVGKLGNAPGELFYPHAVAIDSNDRIFITQLLARISVFSVKGEFLTSFSHQDMRGPYGVAIHGDNLYVTDIVVDSIFHFKIATDFPLIAKRGSFGQQIGKFNSPRNLAVSNNGDVYVTEYYNHRVQIFDSSLLHPRSLTQQLIDHPQDIKLTADEVYVLCDDNRCVHVFSHAGERLRSLISRGLQMQVTFPIYFCLDSAENIIISDYFTDRIKIFTKAGNLITTLGEGGHLPGMFHYPRGLALTKELSLVVVSWNENFCLQIFSCL